MHTLTCGQAHPYLLACVYLHTDVCMHIFRYKFPLKYIHPLMSTDIPIHVYMFKFVIFFLFGNLNLATCATTM